MNPLVKILVLVAVVFGWYKFLTPPGANAPPEKAHKDAKNGFAVVKPEGWELSAKEQCGGPMGACVVAELSKNVEGLAPRPFVQVTSIPGASVRISDSNKAALVDKFGAAMSAQMTKFEPDGQDIIQMDELTALKIAGHGTRHERVEVSPAVYANERMALQQLKKEHPNQSVFWIKQEIKGPRDTPARVIMKEAEYEERDLSLNLGTVLVSGGKRLYLLTYAFDSGKEREYGQAVQDILDSFRVLDRPSPFRAYGGLFGSVPGDAVMGALVGLTIAAFKLLTAY